MDVGVVEARKRLTFTLAIGEGLRLVDAYGDEQIVRVDDLLPATKDDGPRVLLNVFAQERQQVGRFQRPVGQGVIAGDTIVRVVKIGVRGLRKCQLGVSAPQTTLVTLAQESALGHSV